MDMDTNIEMINQNAINNSSNMSTDMYRLNTIDGGVGDVDMMRVLSHSSAMEIEEPVNYTEIIEKMKILIENYGIYRVLDIIEPLYLLMKTNSLLMTNRDDIIKFENAFDQLFKSNKSLLSEILKVKKILSQSSVNGIVSILTIGNSNLLMKYAANEMRSDPSSYEYYVGLTLNNLRKKNVFGFSLLYGRVRCSFNELNGEFCKNENKKTLLFYEFVRSENDKIQSLYNYITTEPIENERELKRYEENILNILLFLLYSLQTAQDDYGFTHYDLHLDNILLIKLEQPRDFTIEYNKKNYTLRLGYLPFIIDFGRSHINKSTKINEFVFNDYEKNNAYNSFEEYQYEIWKGKKFYFNKDKNACKKIIYDNLDILQKKPSFKNSSNSIEEKVNNYMKTFYLDDKNNVKSGIYPLKSSTICDMYKLTRSLCNVIKYRDYTSNFIDFSGVWYIIDDLLNSAYPFYIPGQFFIPTHYDNFSKIPLEKPIDLFELIYKRFHGNTRVRITQIGSGTHNKKMKKIQKIKKQEMNNIKNITDVSTEDRNALQDKTYKKWHSKEFLKKYKKNIERGSEILPVVNTKIEATITDTTESQTT
jgi:hypothetical protein